MIPRLSTIIIFPLLLLSSALSKSNDKFNQLRAKTFPIKADDKSFAAIIDAPRDYSTAVLLTAKDVQFSCQVCRQFDPEWTSLARVWQKNDKGGQSRLVFAEVDFINSRQTFLSLKLETAPVILLYHPTHGPNEKPAAEPSRYDFSSESSAEDVHAWISRRLNAKSPKYVRPFNWAALGIKLILLMGVVTLLVVISPYLLVFLQNRNFWAAASLLAILLFTSGHMFNHIRNVPYVAGDPKGNIVVFAAGFQTQHGLETQIVAAIYVILAFASITLAVKCPRMVSPGYQQGMVFVCASVIYILYAILLMVFRKKNGGYPFYLLPFV